MRITVHHRGAKTTHELVHALELGGDPSTTGISEGVVGAWSCQFRRTDRGWAFDLRAGSQPATTLNGAAVTGNWLYPITTGDHIVAGDLTITIGHELLAIPAAEPLSDLERTLLTTIAREDSDDARRVLADLWQQGDDEARGTLIHAQCEGLELGHELVDRHGDRWRVPAVFSGFLPKELGFDRGFVRPLVIGQREPLARSANAFRLSPVLYHPVRSVMPGVLTEVHEAVRMTASGPDGRCAIKVPVDRAREDDFIVEREIKVLQRFSSPHVPKIRDVALSRQGTAVAFEWRGTNLEDILRAARAADRPPGEAVAIAIGIQLCRALAVVHAAQVTHAEVTPDHVLVLDGHVTLCDFGFAVCNVPRPRVPISPQGRIRARFNFMSPEQVRGEPIDASTDVFALAMLLAELVACTHPIDADSDFATLVAVRDLAFEIAGTRSQLAQRLRAVLVRDKEPRSSAAVFGLELARIAEAAHLRVGPEVIADYVRSLAL